MQRRGDGPAAAVIVMGVSGSGKSTIGKRLAKRLDCKFAEGDALHPPQNIAKMQGGEPLTDADRAPWLEAIALVLEEWRCRGERGVIACSALKKAYRRQLVTDGGGVRLVFLEGARELIAARLAARQAHFMPPSLLESQFAALEPPGPDENPIIVGINQLVEDVIDSIVRALGSPAQLPRSAP